MSLFIDRELVSSEMLSGIDSEVINVAAAENIVLEGDNSIIRQAWVEVGDFLLEVMAQFTSDMYAWPQTLSYAGLYTSNRSRFQLNQVVTTTANYGSKKPSALVTYAAYYALMLFWRAAARRREKDRYIQKYQQALQDAKEARRRLWVQGVPIVFLPLSSPGALLDSLAGEWGASNLSGGTGGTITEATAYDVAITWVDGTVYQGPLKIQNGESGPSAVQSIVLQSGQSLVVNLSGLNPPGALPYQGGVADGVYFSRNASGWNVYAAPSGGNLVLQNSTPIPVATTSYQINTVALSGPVLLSGQVPDINHKPTRTFSRS